jgi:hypothetical protein
VEGTFHKVTIFKKHLPKNRCKQRQSGASFLLNANVLDFFRALFLAPLTKRVKHVENKQNISNAQFKKNRERIKNWG